MHPVIDSHHLIQLVGGAAFVAMVLIVAIYLLQKTVGSTFKPEKSKSARVRLGDEVAFSAATVKGVITQLKADQSSMREKLIAAERRAEQNVRKFELLAREIDYGLMVFDPEGFIAISNPLVRQQLAIDTWSRRRFTEILHDVPQLLELTRECYEHGTEARKKTIAFQGSDGNERHIECSVLKTCDRSGGMECVACLLRDLGSTADGA